MQQMLLFNHAADDPGHRVVSFRKVLVHTRRPLATSFMPMSSSPISLPQPKLPSRRDAVWFEFRAGCFKSLRSLRNLLDRKHRRHSVQMASDPSGLRDSPVQAEVVAPLWSTLLNTERALTFGKVENLRVARRAFDGVELKRGEILSFWVQLGKPTRARGFVIGRELREGCLIPSIGGGLCQLSNALYDAAQQAGLEIIERHAHSQVIPGSAAARDRDATVFWNYVDLRFRAPFDLRFEVDMDADSLRVRIRGESAQATAAADVAQQAECETGPKHIAARVADCGSCGLSNCFRNAPEPSLEGRSLLLAESLSPEYAQHLREREAHAQPLESMRPLRTSLQFRLRSRAIILASRIRKQPIAARSVAQSELRARAAVAQLQPEHTDVYVDQAWIPTLWRSGALAGRRYHVLMHALPMAEIHARLNIAAARYPHEESLRDFRADPASVAAETAALARADRWISTHDEVLQLAGEKALALPWQLPNFTPTARPIRAPGPMRVYFPASSLVRKGVLALAAAMIGLNDAELILPARDGGEPSRWGKIAIRRTENHDAALSSCDVVVLPAWIEHQPRILLTAIARGIPVIATPACGLGALHGWHAVPAGDHEALHSALLLVQEAVIAATTLTPLLAKAAKSTALPTAVSIAIHAP